MKAITLLNPSIIIRDKETELSPRPVFEHDGRVRLTPDSGVTHCRNPFFLPDGTWWHRTLIGVRIDRLGMKISPRFARRYYSEVITAVHPYLHTESSDSEYEWMRDGALIVSDTAVTEAVGDDFLEAFDRCVSEVSRFMTLKTGDLIFFPAPVSDGPTALPLAQGMNMSVSDVPDGFPTFTLKVR